MKKQWGFILAALMTMVVMGGCGGGGGSEPQSAAVNTVSGVAAVGSPLVGTVSLKDSSAPAKESIPATIGVDGAFTINVDGLKPPFILKAQGTAGVTSYTLYSFATASGIANINPIANLAVANAAGGVALTALYAAPSNVTMQAIASNLGKAVTDIQAKLQPLFAAYNVTANPVSGNYTADHLGLDGVLDMVKVTVSETGTVTITNKLTNAVISSGSLSSVANWSPPQNIPLPPVPVVSVGMTISPSTATVTAKSTKTFTASVSNSANTQVTWSVVEAGGGTITSSGVYTAPSTAGTYHVKAVSSADSTKSATATVTVTPTVLGQPFPIGTWVGPHGASFTVTNLVTKAIGLDKYSGTITFPTFGTVNVSGLDSGLEVSQIILGTDFVVNANTINSSGAFTFLVFTYYGVSNMDGPQILSQITGNLLVQSSSSLYSYNETATFVKQ